MNFIPIVTSEAGACLTSANWSEVHVGSVAYSLESLLFKPGLSLLKKIPDIKSYLGWSGQFILNGKNLSANKAGTYTLKSPFDGSTIKFTSIELVELIQHLKPDVVILPKKIMQEQPNAWVDWGDAIKAFIHVDDLQHQDVPAGHGVYFDDLGTQDRLIEDLHKWSHLARYVTGVVHLDLMQRLITQAGVLIESDEPAKAAIQGMVYSKSGLVDLTDKQTELQFEPIDADCGCPTCSQQLTKAYLHHLLLHTPLLCQRFLIQHNIYHWTKVNQVA
ncbi:MAG: queuine tRNA-ribosyltransferase [Legionellales bacterium]